MSTPAELEAERGGRSQGVSWNNGNPTAGLLPATSIRSMWRGSL